MIMVRPLIVILITAVTLPMVGVAQELESEARGHLSRPRCRALCRHVVH